MPAKGLTQLKEYIDEKNLTNDIKDLRKLRELIKNKKININHNLLEQTEKSLDFYSANNSETYCFTLAKLTII